MHKLVTQYIFTRSFERINIKLFKLVQSFRSSDIYMYVHVLKMIFS